MALGGSIRNEDIHRRVVNLNYPEEGFQPGGDWDARLADQEQLIIENHAGEIRDAIRNYYSDSDFVSVVDGTPRLKDVVASNDARIGVACDGDAVVVMSAIDNLVKGAAGGAIQWMNRLWSLPEASGLTAASPAWT